MRPRPSEEEEVKVELQEGDVDRVPQEYLFRIFAAVSQHFLIALGEHILRGGKSLQFYSSR